MKPPTLTDVNIVCPDDRCPKLKIYMSEFISDTQEYLPAAHVRMHNLTLLKLTVARCVGTRSILSIYLNGPIK